MLSPPPALVTLIASFLLNNSLQTVLVVQRVHPRFLNHRRKDARRRSTHKLSQTTKDQSSSSSSSSLSSSDGFDENPDLAGVFVDGFPLPTTPVRDNDDELLAALRSVPVTPLDDPTFLQPRTLPTTTTTRDRSSLSSSPPPLRILIAGGGLGGLALASTLIQKGFDVHVFEQATQYKPFGGPIQIQSNALWALQQINPMIYEAIAEVGVQTGDRLSGIKDGIRHEQEGWLVKFDAATPARKRGLPLTLAINRVVLQEIFLKYGIPPERVHTSQRVVKYVNLKNKKKNSDDEKDDKANSPSPPLGHGVEVHLEDGSKVYGDLLVGADGIWSRVRHQMYNLPPDQVGPQYATQHARYSGYTCYTGTCQHTPSDIQEVAYKVFLGQEQYLGCTDCGHGWQHWWAFLPDPPGGGGIPKNMEALAVPESPLERLKREFHDWHPDIHDLFHATPPEVVKRRDLFDRFPLTKGWSDGSVTLLGDSCHPTMPNLGQGGAMAIEDAYVLGLELEQCRHTSDIPNQLKAYEDRRFLRTSVAQYLSRNGSDSLVDWERLRTTPIVGPIAMWMVNILQPITMNYLYSSDL